MNAPTFHPKSHSVSAAEDKVEKGLKNAAQTILLIVGGFLPLLFLPTPFLPLGLGKTLLVVFGLSVALVLYSLSLLRSGSFNFRLPLLAVTAWLVALVSIASAFLSGDVTDALFGDNLGSYTAVFTLLMALIITGFGIMSDSKQSIIRLYALFIISAVVLSFFHLTRIFLGTDFLSLGIFDSATASPLGGWNGLALFFGLTIFLILMSISQLPLIFWGRVVMAAILVVALLMLMVINFYPVFVVLAAVSILVLLYSLTKDRWLGGQLRLDEDSGNSLWSMLLCVLVTVISLLMLFDGGSIANFINEKTEITFIEVRPSLGATIDIGRNVYDQNLFFGVGPNKFVDAWRTFKDVEINETIFWANNFDTGYSYLITSAVSGGLLVAVAWIGFIMTLLLSAFKLLFRADNSDSFWYFIGLSSMTGSLYFWGMSLVYVPPPSIMLLAFVCTGVFMVSYMKLVPGKQYSIDIARHRNYGFLLVAIVMILIVGSASSSYILGKRVLASYEFNKAVATVESGDTLEELESEITSAFKEANNDFYMRQLAYYQLAQLQALQTVSEPTELEIQAFQTALQKGVSAAQSAVDLDNTDPQNWQVLGQIYGLLAIVGVDGAKERADEALAQARNYDPKNPILPLLEAQLASQTGDLAAARSKAEESIRLRSRFTEAIFFLTQLDVSEGNVEQAIVRTSGLVQLEPQNPARRYQLGVLLANNNRFDEAVAAFESAIALDAQYANARYYLALVHIERGETEEALRQLRAVSELNPENEDVKKMIEDLSNGVAINSGLSDSEPVPEDANTSGESAQVTDDDLDNDLVTSPNPAPDEVEETDDSTTE